MRPLNFSNQSAQMDDWPEAWKGFASDLPTGRKIVDAIRPFVMAMTEGGMAPRTIKRHMANLWLLGGELISETHWNPELKRKSGTEILLKFVSDDGGPLSRHNDTEEAQRAFDSTCRKLSRHLLEKPLKRFRSLAK